MVMMVMVMVMVVGAWWYNKKEHFSSDFLAPDLSRNFPCATKAT